MTREKHLAIVRAALKSGLRAGFTPDQIAEGIVNRMGEALEIEAEEASMGVVVDMEDIRNPAPVPDQRQQPKEWRDNLAPPPVAEHDSKQSSLILDPNAPAAKAKDPVRLPPPGSSKENPNAPRRYWKQEHLREYIAANTPETISVVPEGRKSSVTLMRNIEVLFGVDLVKLIYRIGDERQAEPSSPNPDGNQLSPIAIDTPVFATFSCFDRDQNIESKLEAIHNQAVQVYRPRPEAIASTTPIRSGPIRYTPNDPHDETDPLTNPLTGQVH